MVEAEELIARHLQQVKEGLVSLHNASYFTLDEWIKLDIIIHKGHYEFTKGPPESLPDGAPLLVFQGLEDDTVIELDIDSNSLLESSNGAKCVTVLVPEDSR